MKRLLFFIYVILFVISVIPVNAKSIFTQEEEIYIQHKKTITIGVFPGNEPFSYYRNGKIQGYCIDFLNMTAQASGLNIEYKVGNWSTTYASFIKGEIDVINEISKTPERSRIMSFTDPYYIRKIVAMTRKNAGIQKTDSMHELQKKRVGYVMDVFYSDFLSKSNLNLTQFGNNVEMMNALASGWIDVVFISEQSGKFIAKEKMFKDVVSIGTLNIQTFKDEDIRMGVMNGNPLLISILDKAIKSIPQEKKDELLERWHLKDGQEVFPSNKLIFTEVEKQFIKSNPEINVSVSVDFYPFSFLSANGESGYTVDLLKTISSRTGLNFAFIAKEWSGAFKDFMEGKTDVIADITFPDGSKTDLLYTQEYAHMPTYVFVRNDFGNFKGLGSLDGLRVGVLANAYYGNAFDISNMKELREYSTRTDMLKDLAQNKIDAAIMSVFMGTKLIKEAGIEGISIGGELKIGLNTQEDLRFGVNIQKPLLFSIIVKALDSISQEEKESLTNQWLSLAQNEVNRVRIIFNPEETEYLKRKKEIKMCVDPDWMPIEKLEKDGKYIGMSADFLDIMKRNSGISVEIVPSSSWTETMKMAKDRQCDVISMAMMVPERTSYLNFTEPYLNIPIVIATSMNTPYIDDLANVIDKKFAITRNNAVIEILRRMYPKINLVICENYMESLSLLQNGEVYGAIGNMAGLGYQMRQEKIVDVKIAGRLPMDLDLSMAIRNDEPILKDIMQKLVHSISDEEKNDIVSKWMNIRYEQVFDYSILWKISSVFLIIALIIAYWSNKIRKLNKKLHNANLKLQELSSRDGLTGIYNRRHFDMAAKSTFNLCKRRGIRFSAAIIDIDHFKKVNDAYGHLFGDICLQEMARILQRHFLRDTDMCARFGGEEFAVFITDEDESTLIKKIDEVRMETETTIVTSDGIATSFTVSGGVYTAIPKTDDTLEDTLRRADEALYRAKTSGRNKVVMWRENTE